MSTQNFQPLIQSAYEDFQSLLQTRLSSSDSMSWMLTEPSTTFMPDYFTLHKTGSSPLLRQLNYYLHKLSPKLWRHFIWKKIVTKTVLFLEQELHDKFKSSLSKNDFAQFKALFFSQLHDFLLKAPLSEYKAITQSTFTELFHFFSVLSRELCGLFEQSNDLYLVDKQKQNQSFEQIYTEIRDELFDSEHCFEALIYLSVRGNWMDSSYELLEQFERGFKEELNMVLNEASFVRDELASMPFVHLKKIHKTLHQGPLRIFYELDNAGEVYIDFLLIEYLLKAGHKIYLVTKKHPTLNDITLDDFKTLIMRESLSHLHPYFESKAIQVFHSGSESVGKNPFRISKSYQKAYQTANLVILKGQGNLQTMPMGQVHKKRFIPYSYRCPILYLSGIKAPMIQESLGTVFPKNQGPAQEALFAYYFDPKDKTSYPLT